MLSRRDQVQAYKFLTRRQSSALLHGEADTPEAPMRKLGVAAFSSAMAGVLAIAVFGVIGLINPSSSGSWKSGTALIVDSNTNTRYIYSGGVLHPVLNYASARLILKATSLATDTVTDSDLSGTPRGLPVGIPGAPDDLPGTSGLMTGPWTVCSLPATDTTGAVRPYVQLTVGTNPPGTPMPTGQGLLIRGNDGNVYLVWNNERLRLAANFVRQALGYETAQPTPVGDGLLEALPQGPDLAPPTIPGMGGLKTFVPNMSVRVGQVLTVSGIGTAPQAYAVYNDGLAPITPTEEDILLADPDVASAAYPGGSPAATLISAASAAEAPVSGSSSAPDASLPPSPPRLVDTAGVPVETCALDADVTGASVNVSVQTVPLDAAQAATLPAGHSPVDAQGGPIADAATLPPGHGVVVRALPEPGVSQGTLYLVTDLGVKYPIPDATQLPVLGMSNPPVAQIPTVMLQLLPTGPALDEADATQSIPVLPDINGSAAPQPPAQAPSSAPA